MIYWTMDYFKVLYNQFQTSGQTIRAFCKEQGIHEARFYFWVKKLKDNKSITWSKQRITLTYPNGVIIQIDNLDDLSVLKQLITLV